MERRGRPVDNSFRDHHGLYYRCTKEDFEDDGRLNPSRIRCDNTSVNWSKYSKPWDVIFDHPGFGIVRFLVKELPKELPKQPPKGANVRSFYPVHDPMDENYAHAEIGTFDGQKRIANPNLGKIVKTEFRMIMRDRAMLILPPKV
jgi:hypothetical protein